MELDYVKKVQEWVELDNVLMRSKEATKEAVSKKKELEDSILEYVEQNKLDKLSLSISDGVIKFAKKTTPQSLSHKVLRSILEDYAEEHPDIDVGEICDFVASKLEKRTTFYMKRDIK